MPCCLTLLLLDFLITSNIVFDKELASSSCLLSDIWITQTFIGLVLNFFQFFYQIGKHQSIANFLTAVYDVDKKVRKNSKTLYRVFQIFLLQFKSLGKTVELWISANKEDLLEKSQF